MELLKTCKFIADRRKFCSSLYNSFWQGIKCQTKSCLLNLVFVTKVFNVCVLRDLLAKRVVNCCISERPLFPPNHIH